MKDWTKFVIALFIGAIVGTLTQNGWIAVITALLVYLFWGVWKAFK